jgi:hypothetical protein
MQEIGKVKGPEEKRGWGGGGGRSVIQVTPQKAVRIVHRSSKEVS